MDKRQIDNFFQALNERLQGDVKGKVRIILTGAAAGVLLGGNRPSIDIDFALSCGKKYFKKTEQGINQVSQLSGIAVNFSEDIDRWSQITFLDYRRHMIPYKTFGMIEVSILSPDYWSIGKITRYLDIDVDDLVKVLKNNHIPPSRLAMLWARALTKSPRSSISFNFTKNVEHFFKTYGRRIWGIGYNPDVGIETFYSAAGLKRQI